MNFAIARVKKLKTLQDVRQANRHNTRTMPVPNCDGSGNFEIVGSDDPAGTIKALINDSGIKTRKDSVHAIEVMLTASPEAFVDSSFSQAWEKKAVDFIKNKYGKNVVQIAIHRDEKTPHIQAIIVPVESKRRKRRGREEYYSALVLNAKGLFGKAQLRLLQDEYAEAMGSMGLKRGLPGSKAHHTTVKDFYKTLDSVFLEKAPVANDQNSKISWYQLSQKLWAHIKELKRQLDLHRKSAPDSVKAADMRVIEMQEKLAEAEQRGFMACRERDAALKTLDSNKKQYEAAKKILSKRNRTLTMAPR